MPPEQHQQEQQQSDDEDDGDFTFPTPPPQFLAGVMRDKDRHFHQLPCSPSSSPPVWLQHFSSSPIRRSFSAADCAASPWRHELRCRRGGGCSPALSDFFNGEEEEEERMDSLWEDLNDDKDFAAGVSRRRSVDVAAARASKDKVREVLGASRSSRRRPPGLVTMMRALKKMFVAHKSKSRVLHKDEQSNVASASASASPAPSLCNKK